MLVGYCRVSVADDRQTTDLQGDAFLTSGVDERNILGDRMSGAKDERPGLKACLDYLKKGDILVVWRLDRPGFMRSHFTTKEVPAVALGILDKSLSWEELFMLPLAA